MATEEGRALAAAESKAERKKRKYPKKDKPWDTDDIDHWKVEPFDPDDERLPKQVLVEESAFSTLFPKYREQYLKEVWSHVTSALGPHGVDCSLDLIEGSMTVRTTRKTRDPYIIIKARDFIKLLSRSVPYEQAVKVLRDDMSCDIIKINGMVRNKERFAKRRQRLIGPNGNTLKAIELLTECYVLVQGNTVSCMGPFKGLKQARRIIEDTMRNVHPIYNIKTMMIKRELAKDPTLKNENWDRFLPKFKRNASSKPKPKKKPVEDKDKKKEYTPFPPAPTPRKVDLEMESGVYFLSDRQKKAHRREEQADRQAAHKKRRTEERKQAFVAPKDEAVELAEHAPAPKQASIGSLAQSVVANTQKMRQRAGGDQAAQAADFVRSKKKKKDKRAQ